MGLDMYLYAKNYISHYDDEGKAKGQEVLKLFPELAGLSKLEAFHAGQVKVNLMYWRKVNAIHQWFVDNCQEGRDECQETEVPLESLRELLTICQEVLADHSKAGELLPPQGGFFFGSTAMDEFYFQDVQETADGLSILLENFPDKGQWYVYYRSSW